jgi:hypothetical protein
LLIDLRRYQIPVVDGGKQSVAFSGHEQVLLLKRQDD